MKRRASGLLYCAAGLFLSISVSASVGCCVNRPYGQLDPCSHKRLGDDGCSSCAQGGRVRSGVSQLLTCGSACGEVYWDEWLSDPPDCCDPCDECSGKYIGPQCCDRNRRFRGLFGSLWGCRGDQCCDDMCDSCAGRGCNACDGSGHMHAEQPSQAGSAAPRANPRSTVPSSPNPNPKASRPLMTRPVGYSSR